MGEEARACAGVATLAASVEDETVGKNAAATGSRRVRARAGRRVADGLLGERRRKTHVVDVVADAGAESGEAAHDGGDVGEAALGRHHVVSTHGAHRGKALGGGGSGSGGDDEESSGASSRAMICVEALLGVNADKVRSEETRAFQNGRRDDESGRRRDGGRTERRRVPPSSARVARVQSQEVPHPTPKPKSRAERAAELFDDMLE